MHIVKSAFLYLFLQNGLFFHHGSSDGFSDGGSDTYFKTIIAAPPNNIPDANPNTVKNWNFNVLSNL